MYSSHEDMTKKTLQFRKWAVMSGSDWDANFFCKEKSIDRRPIYVQSYDTNALSTNVLSRTNRHI
jgi:hypothetical protein